MLAKRASSRGFDVCRLKSLCRKILKMQVASDRVIDRDNTYIVRVSTSFDESYVNNVKPT